MTLTQEQFQKARSAGLTTEQIIQFEKKRQQTQPAMSSPQVSTQQPKPSMLGTITKAALPGSALFKKETWQPAAQSITGKSLTQRSQEMPISAKMTGNKVMDTVSAVGAGLHGFQRDVVATAADMATTPANYLGVGIVNQASKVVSTARNIENRIFNLYNFAVGGKLKNVGDVSKIIPERVNAMRTISDNLPNIKLTNLETGAVEAGIPKNRLDLLQAFNQTKKLIWGKVNALSQGATEQSASINLPKIVDEALTDTTKQLGRVALKSNPGLDKILSKASKDIKTAGVTNPTEAEEYMKYLNNEVQRLRNSGQAMDFSVKDLYGNVLNKLNEATDTAIEKALSQSGYRDLRKQYSHLKSAEKEILAGANKFLRQSGGQGGGITHPIINIWSIEEMLRAGAQAATGNVLGAAKSTFGAGLIKSAGKIADYFKSPDRRIEQIFKLLQKGK